MLAHTKISIIRVGWRAFRIPDSQWNLCLDFDWVFLTQERALIKTIPLLFWVYILGCFLAGR